MICRAISSGSGSVAAIRAEHRHNRAAQARPEIVGETVGGDQDLVDPTTAHGVSMRHRPPSRRNDVAGVRP